MHVYILGGFLGAGKTTLLMRIANELINKGKRVVTLVNEVGKVGVDGITIKSSGYTTIELPSGCICCTLAGSLQENFVQIKQQYRPDVVLIEPTGIAIPDRVMEIVKLIEKPEIIKIFGVADVPRFDLFVSKKKDFYLRQLGRSDLLILTKIDLAKEGDIERIRKWFSKEVPGVELVPVCSNSDNNMCTIFKEMKQ
ncbi:MAG: GTPase [archaeon]|nr:GTPase [archaeon]